MDINSNKIMLFSGKWMELEIIMFSKISQAQKPNIACFHSCEIYIYNDRNNNNDNRLNVKEGLSESITKP
jgi:hypothetical protein